MRSAGPAALAHTDRPGLAAAAAGERAPRGAPRSTARPLRPIAGAWRSRALPWAACPRSIPTSSTLARLSRLSLRDDEREAFARQLGEVIAYLEALQSIDVDAVPPWRPEEPAAAPLRDDVAGAAIDRDRVLAAVPASEDGLVTVPRFVES
ncbi:MAG: Asp-tRNA(Asn)/Glu-tRNA(Gln) amidotransferase subunit GatC [Nannocystaceae bacterium]